MDTRNVVEIELLSGKRILLPNKWDKIYDLCEKTRWLLRRAEAFPFFKFEKQRYVKFKFRTRFETIDDFFDPKFRVKCTLSQFASMFGIKVTPFERMLVENDLAYDPS